MDGSTERFEGPARKFALCRMHAAAAACRLSLVAQMRGILRPFCTECSVSGHLLVGDSARPAHAARPTFVHGAGVGTARLIAPVACWAGVGCVDVWRQVLCTSCALLVGIALRVA